MTNALDFSRKDFDDDFLFGVATSAHQIEGSSFGGCGMSHWDTFAGTKGNTARADNGSIACDHYHRFEEDLDLIANANFDHYRFSVSWARVMPDGKTVNPDGLDFYDRLTDAMLKRGIKPMLTLHHWEQPAALADLGGWRNPDISDRFAEFTDVITQRIGDRMWASGTFNEPWCITWLSHFMGIHAPGIRDIRATTRSIHHLLIAHGKSIDVMRSNGMDNLGIYLNFEPSQAATDSQADKLAAARYHAQYNQCFVEPLFKGTYPKLVLEAIEKHLPEKWQDDMALIQRPIDWLGINNYTRKIVRHDGSDIWPAFEEAPTELPLTEMGWEVSPNTFGWLLEWVTEYTGNLPLFVTENGMAGPDAADNGTINDPWRIDYLNSHVTAMQGAIENGAPIKGYTVWSLLDNYEWSLGYDKRFGIVYVDYETLERTPKQSWYALQEVLSR